LDKGIAEFLKLHFQNRLFLTPAFFFPPAFFHRKILSQNHDDSSCRKMSSKMELALADALLYTHPANPFF